MSGLESARLRARPLEVRYLAGRWPPLQFADGRHRDSSGGCRRQRAGITMCKGGNPSHRQVVSLIASVVEVGDGAALVDQ